MQTLSYFAPIVVTVGLASAQCTTDDAFEDNDLCTTATHLGDGVYGTLWLHRFDPDFFRMCVAPGATLRTECHFADNILALQARLTDGCTGQAIGNLHVNVDLVRWTYTNNTGVDQQVTLEVYHHTTIVLLPCGTYDLVIIGSGGCATVGTVFCDPGGVNSAGS